MQRSGHFWQGRFGCVALDEPHLAAAVPYVALNPVRAGLVAAAGDWPWSSAPAHLGGAADCITALAPVAERYPDFAALIGAEPAPEMLGRLRRAESIGRPLGSDSFIRGLEATTGQTLDAARRGPKPSEPGDAGAAMLPWLATAGVGAGEISALSP